MRKSIICFGDSNTHGYQAENNGRFSEEERWPCLLEKFLGNDYHIFEEGLSGRTIVFEDPLFEGLNGYTSLFQCLMTHEPLDLLIIMLGTNDTKARFNVNAENIAKGMERLIQKAICIKEAWHTTPNILLISPVPIEENYINTIVAGEMGEGCAEKSRALSFYYKDISQRLNCHFLDAGTIPGIKMYSKDYMHLDKQSHLLLAKKLADIIPSFFI